MVPIVPGINRSQFFGKSTASLNSVVNRLKEPTYWFQKRPAIYWFQRYNEEEPHESLTRSEYLLTQMRASLFNGGL